MSSFLRPNPLVLVFLLVACLPELRAAEILSLTAKNTLSAVELDAGDELRFTLAGGRTVCLAVEGTEAAIVERVEPGGIVYRFECRVRIDGQSLTLRRFVCAQECFCEPYVVDGLRIWLDTVRDAFDMIPIRYPEQGNRQCLPRKAVRLAVQDATLRICPSRLEPWIDEPQDQLDVGRCYNGDDCYLGPYLGQACHVGLDVNQPKGSVLTAPLDFDTHAYFNSVARGDNNNRWRGVRRWENGDVWALQTHHLIELLVPPQTRLAAGTRYATTAGVHVGSHPHTHFEFKIGRPRSETPQGAGQDAASIVWPIDFDDQSPAAQQNPEVLHLDPWLIFWQIFEDRRARRGLIQAALPPLAPTAAGETVAFSAAGSRAGPDGGPLSYVWTFGDGGCRHGPAPTHVFARAGVYPVTLVVDDGSRRASCTQHMVVDGQPIDVPVLALDAPDEPAFRPRPVEAADVYGRPVKTMPHTLRFVARASRPVPQPKTVLLRNTGGGRLGTAGVRGVEPAAKGWLRLETGSAHGTPAVTVSVDATGLAAGTYAAAVQVACAGALNSPQDFRVELAVREHAPGDRVTVDDDDEGCVATPYFWVGHRFCRCPAERRGWGGFYLTNGGWPEPGQSVRFTPDLLAGVYEVRLSDATPFRPGTEFGMRVRHRGGESLVRVRPESSRRIGRFEFEEGSDGFVELQAGGSQNLVIADALVFQREGTSAAAR